MITVVGMGRNEGDLTLHGDKLIRDAEVIIVKTSLNRTFEYFDLNKLSVITLDDIYEQAKDFDELNRLIIEKVITYKDQNTVYCVDGSGYDDFSVIALKKILNIEIVAGISYEGKALSNMPSANYTAIFATDFIDMRSYFPDTNLALVIKEIDNYLLASDIKLKLMNLIGDHEIYYLIDEEMVKISISDLDRQPEYDNTSLIIIPPLGNYDKTRYNFSDLMEITYRLRDPDGCKWDKAQTHLTIRANAIEEAYELVEAIDLDDIDKMCEETGDVLLQGVFHAVIGENKSEYDINDVLTTLCRKLITRHTHIFGNVKAENSEEALKAWENAKAVEKGHQSYSDKLDAIAANLPALMRAYKVQKAAKKSGFDWKDINGAIGKVNEEMNELLSADKEHQEMEGGDLIFAAVNVLRFMDINPEIALNRTIAKFVRRFRFMEENITKSGKSLEESTLEEMDKYWELSKNEDR